ncbi:MAG TPA: hypothetical protein VHM90_16425 [Phycisphaerae bacterium]|jgi:hypothetical protein|nr:hypothetical protein [Phycisphaerae bacterium]
MRVRVRYFLRLFSVLLLLSLIPGAATPRRASVPATDPQMIQPELARAPFEVRLRKLHLVRPDLIPYPIFFEVYC